MCNSYIAKRSKASKLEDLCYLLTTYSVLSGFPMFLKSLTGLKCMLIEGRGDHVCGYITQNGLVEIVKERLREIHVLLWSAGRSDYEFELSRKACQTIS